MSEFDADPPIYLTDGTCEATILPGLGGSVSRLVCDGIELLLPAADDTRETADGAGCFALVPWANRIAGGDFTFAGTEQRLRLNAHPELHAHHGLGWQSVWTPTHEDSTSATLVLNHEGDPRWPWPFRGEQHFALDGDGLTITLSATNTADEAQPIGLGFHPFLPTGAGATVTVSAPELWLTRDNLPTTRAAAGAVADLSAGADRDTLPAIDNCYAGWSGEARIDEAAGGGIRLAASAGFGFVQVYAVPGEPWLCIEPVTHMPNALNRTEDAAVTGLHVLAPGETLSATLRIERVAVG